MTIRSYTTNRDLTRDGDRSQLGPIRCHRRVEQPPGQRLGLADINGYAFGKTKLQLACRQRLAPCRLVGNDQDTHRHRLLTGK